MTANAKGEYSVSFFDRFKIRARSAEDVRNRKSDGIEELSALVRERPDDWATANVAPRVLVASAKAPHDEWAQPIRDT